jgi:hypothetical protein
MVWNNPKPKEDPIIKDMKDGENMTWWFEDWRKRREVNREA